MLFYIFILLIRRKINSAQIDTSSVPIPVSVSIEHTEISGGHYCGHDISCNSISLTPFCGAECYSKSPFDTVFQYTFIGVGFQVFGTFDNNHFGFNIYLDEKLIQSIDEKAARQDYAHLYTSDLLPYGVHTIKINSTGVFELHKFTYWPTINGARLNSTDVVQNWVTESDYIGGILKSANSDIDEQSVTINCSKIWIIGSKGSNHGNLILKIDNGEDINIDENSAQSQKYAVVYQKELPLGLHTFSFRRGSNYVSMNCIFYEALPTQGENHLAFPISVPISGISINGDVSCNIDDHCLTDKISTSSCGEKCYTTGNHDASFEYKFTGVQVHVFGTNNTNHGLYDVYIDGNLVETVSQKIIAAGHSSPIYSTLQFSSEILPYGEHTIKTVGKGSNAYEIYKFTYVPSVRALRINTTDISPVWEKQQDDIGGFRDHANSDNYKDSIKSISLVCSKLWIIGTKGPEGEFYFWIDNNEKVLINTKSSGNNVLSVLYMTDTLSYGEHIFNIQYKSGTVVLNSIFYDPLLPDLEVPVSVNISSITITGDVGCNTDHQCSNDEIETSLCGPKCYTTGKHLATFEYTFTGVQFQIYGTYDPNHRDYYVYIDGKIVDTVTQQVPAGTAPAYSKLQYTSDILPYGEHTIKTAGKGDGCYEISKFAYFPTLAAHRINFTDFTKSGANQWSTTSDGNGGLRMYVESGTILSKTIQCSKFWIIGSKSSIYRSMTIKFGDYEATLNEYLHLDNNNQLDKVIVFESPELPYYVGDLILNATGKVALYCIYYLDNPPLPSVSQTPEPSPSETPEPSPTKGPFDLFEVYDKDLNDDGRVVKVINDDDNNSKITVSVKVTDFIHLKHTDDGGAIHIKNTGFLCSNTHFEDCNSSSFGGAIYIKTSISFEAPITLDHLTFDECRSKCGGAVYIYCDSLSCNVLISSCTFSSNNLFENENNENLENIGGSAIYLSVASGKMIRNKFVGNKGGEAIKLYNQFNGEVDSIIQILDNLNEKRSVVISECEFEINRNYKSSLFFVTGNKGSSFKLSGCTFNDSLENGTYYIDGINLINDAPKLVVENCMFSNSFNNSFNLYNTNNFLSIDIKNQVFKYNNYQKDKVKSSFYLEKVFIIPTTAVVLVALLAFILMLNKNRNNDVEDKVNNENQDLSSL